MRQEFPPESVPCSLKAGEGPTRFALAGQEPTALPGEPTEGTRGRNVHTRRKGGLVTGKPQQGPAWDNRSPETETCQNSDWEQRLFWAKKQQRSHGK